MSAPHLPPLNRAHAQQGAALITALLLLVVLTILGLSVMQMSRVQEKMAGNTRDINIGFEAAEAALRNAEALIDQKVSAPIGCPADPPPCAFWQKGTVGDVASQPAQWWKDNAAPFTDASGQPMKGVAENPQFVIEVLMEDTGLPSPPTVNRVFYQVTARSTGASGLANTIVQSTFARKY
jgi:type IV pilus assembly protein PilX